MVLQQLQLKFYHNLNRQLPEDFLLKRRSFFISKKLILRIIDYYKSVFLNFFHKLLFKFNVIKRVTIGQIKP